MLLSLSPKSDGTIPENQKQVVFEIGMWLWTFGEAIYETRPFSISGETTAGDKQVHYTKKGKFLNAIFLDWPGGEKEMTTTTDIEVTLEQLKENRLNSTVKTVTLLGLKKLEDIPFNLTSQGLVITIPVKTRVPFEFAQVFRIELE